VLYCRTAACLSWNAGGALTLKPPPWPPLPPSLPCRRPGLKFAPRNGGHSYEANSLLDGGVVIDLRALNSLQVDAGKGQIVLGAGRKLVRAGRALLCGCAGCACWVC
jgi:hypothetical protein